MNRCVFCKTESGAFTTREHILPESLGGGESEILPDGLFCDSCQNRFGSEIEQQALSDYPFAHIRVFLGIPTKRKKAPWMRTWEGILRGSPQANTVGYDVAPVFEKAFLTGQKTQLRVVAEPARPDMVCRALLKMGLETLAREDPEMVFESRFDRARAFALTGKKSIEWWYIQQEDMQMFGSLMRNGVTPRDWEESVDLSISEPVEGGVVFRLEYLSHFFLLPLVGNCVPPPMDELPEPEWRLFRV